MKTTEKIDKENVKFSPMNLNFIRSKVAKRPDQTHITEALEKANKLYQSSKGRTIEVQPYTR